MATDHGDEWWRNGGSRGTPEWHIRRYRMMRGDPRTFHLLGARESSGLEVGDMIVSIDHAIGAFTVMPAESTLVRRINRNFEDQMRDALCDLNAALGRDRLADEPDEVKK